MTATGPSARPMLLRGGSIHACDGRTPVADALVIVDGRVVAIGSEAELRSRAGRDPAVVDLRGATVMPGFVDTHPHLFHFGVLAAPLVDITDAQDRTPTSSRASRARPQTTPDGEWIMTTPVGEPHYFLRRSWRDLAEGRLPDRHVLDRASDRPSGLTCRPGAPTTPERLRRSTRAALGELGIDRATPDRPSEHVWIEKDARRRADRPPARLGQQLLHRRRVHGRARSAGSRSCSRRSVLGGMVRAMASTTGIGVTTIYEGHVMGPAGDRGLPDAARQRTSSACAC